MNKYIIYFEIFGKKMKTEIMAVSEDSARSQVYKRLNFLKIEKKDVDFEDIFPSFYKKK